MVIDKIGNVGKIFHNQSEKPLKSAETSKSMGDDTVSISNEALKARDISQSQLVVRKADDMRMDRVKQVKAKLDRGEYDQIDTEILDRVADKIVESLIR